MRTMQPTVSFKDWLRAALAVALLSTLAACGGSDNNHSSGSSSVLNGGSLPPSPTAQPDTRPAGNAVSITVNRGLAGVPNIPAVSVTVCAPGSTTNCQTISNVQLDTGSFGLRLASSALNQSLLNALPVSTLASSGAQLAECATFADGYTWGSVRTATVAIGGETTATAIPLQIIGDKDASTVPADACGSGSAENTVADLGANGILGVGTALTDCGANCVDPTTALSYSNYFACPGGSSCTRTAVPLAQQVANPVANFATDNNGLIVQMPPLPDAGAKSATGTLVFGIGTASNNTLSAANVFGTDGYGNLNSSTFNGANVKAFLDSGSNAYFFVDNSLTLCPSAYAGFYCPTSAQTRSLTLAGTNQTSANVSIGIVSASTLFSSSGFYAFNNLAGQIGSDFDLGLPFFYGRHVYYGFDRSDTGGQAPFVAF